MRSRSNLLVMLGIAFFVVGGILVFLLTDDDDGDSGSPTAPVSAVVSNIDVPAGTLADELIAAGNLREIEVPANELAAGAVRTVNQLEGATFVQGFAKDQQITSGGLQLNNRTFEVPAGYEAMSVQMDFVNGGAGYINVGDRINVYTAFDTDDPVGDRTLPRSELILSNVEVLDVNLTIPARRGTVTTDGTTRASGDVVTFLLAVHPADAEKLSYSDSFQTLYATLTSEGLPPAGDTPGQDGENVPVAGVNVAGA